MTSTYEIIAYTTLSSQSATVEFMNIPATYTDIVAGFKVGWPTGSSSFTRLRFNGDAGANYVYQIIQYSQYDTQYYAAPDSFINITTVGGTSVGRIDINNYASTTTYKTVTAESGSGNNTGVNGGIWQSSSAITTLGFYLEGGFEYAVGSTFYIYGIKSK